MSEYRSHHRAAAKAQLVACFRWVSFVSLGADDRSAIESIVDAIVDAAVDEIVSRERARAAGGTE